jgi:hypothetical protein
VKVWSGLLHPSIDGDHASFIHARLVRLQARLRKFPTSVACAGAERVNTWTRRRSTPGPPAQPSVSAVAGIADDVVVLRHTSPDVWNEKRNSAAHEDPLTPEDMKELELHGV